MCSYKVNTKYTHRDFSDLRTTPDDQYWESERWSHAQVTQRNDIINVYVPNNNAGRIFAVEYRYCMQNSGIDSNIFRTHEQLFVSMLLLRTPITLISDPVSRILLCHLW